MLRVSWTSWVREAPRVGPPVRMTMLLGVREPEGWDEFVVEVGGGGCVRRFLRGCAIVVVEEGIG